MDYAYWASLTDADLAGRDLAEFNLECASGLPPAGELDVEAVRRDLDDRAEVIQSATARAVRMRGNDPDYDDLSDSHFRIVCLGSMLRGMGVTKNFAVIEHHEMDASDARVFFIHDAFNGYPSACVPLAVLFTALGRRLGYPVHLVHATMHIFCRWEGADGEKFNFEPTSYGQHSYPDEHYRTWPRERNSDEKRLLRFLQNLTPREELAHFICHRAHVLMENLLAEEAERAMYWCCKICPDDPSYQDDWAAITIARRAMSQIRNRKITDPYEVGLCIPSPVKVWETVAYHRAKYWLTRVICKMQRRSGEDVEAGYAQRARALEEFLSTRIDTCSMQQRRTQ